MPFMAPLSSSSVSVAASSLSPSSSNLRPVSRTTMVGGIPRPLRLVATAGAIFLGGMFTLSLASSATIRLLQAATEAKWKKVALPCGVCKRKGFYPCKLCKGNSTIEWSPLYDPIVINPCVCPTCEGNRVQRCLNCLGKGYYF